MCGGEPRSENALSMHMDLRKELRLTGFLKIGNTRIYDGSGLCMCILRRVCGATATEQVRLHASHARHDSTTTRSGAASLHNAMCLAVARCMMKTTQDWAGSSPSISSSCFFIDRSKDKAMGPRHRLPLVSPVGEGLNLSKPCSHGRPWNKERGTV